MGIFKTIYWNFRAYYDVLEMNIRKNIFKQKSEIENKTKVAWTLHRLRKNSNYDETKILSEEKINNMLKDL